MQCCTRETKPLSGGLVWLRGNILRVLIVLRFWKKPRVVSASQAAAG
jgi:hypothetical protein